MNPNITRATEALKSVLAQIDIDSLPISEYNKSYLLKYQKSFDHYMWFYSQLLEKTISGRHKLIEDSVFVDYGGGCGILSFLASMLGFRKVIYCDIYEQSVVDVQVIADRCNIKVDHFVHGDSDELVAFLSSEQIAVDYVCSFDVIEHIYDLQRWLTPFANLKTELCISAFTTANPYNRYVVHNLKKIHHQSEYVGYSPSDAWKEADAYQPYLKIREEIIREYFNGLDNSEYKKLAQQTRGLRKEDIIKAVGNYIETGTFEYDISHSSNTCDPFTGNWCERLIDFDRLEQESAALHYSINIEAITHYPKRGWGKQQLITLVNKIIETGSQLGLNISPAVIVRFEKQESDLLTEH